MKTKNSKWFLTLLIGLTACYDFPNVEKIDIDPFQSKFVFQIMDSKITFAELAGKTGANSVIEEYPGSDLYFISFRDTVDIGLASDLFPIGTVALPSQTFSFGALAPGFTSVGPLTVPLSQSYDAIPGAELKRIDYNDGTIQLSLVNTYSHSISGNITLTSLKNASNVSMVIPITLNSSESKTYTQPLNGYYLDLLELPSTYNSIKFSVTATITSSGSPNLAGSLGIQLSMSSTNQKITGKLTYTYNAPDQSYDIGIFESTILAEQHFSEPKFKLNFVNSFGFPSSVQFAKFEVENRIGDKVLVSHEGPTNPNDLLIGSENILKYATNSKLSDTTKLQLTSTNSNVEDLFDIAPKSMSFSGATFNIGNALDASHDYFVRSDSKFQLISDIEIPLSGYVVTNLIGDTIRNMDWPDLKEDLKMTDAKVKFKFKFTNSMPINLFIQFEFLDASGIKIATLFDEGETRLIQSSDVDPITGETSAPKEAYSYITIDKAKYDQISQSQDMVIAIKFSTGGSDHQNIKILSTNSLALMMQIEINGTVDI